MGRVQGKVALVTGGAGGLGAATVRMLAREGARVAVCDLADEAGEALAKEVGGDYHRLDVSSEAAWKSVVETVVAKHGAIDVLVNLAGIEGDISASSPETTSLAEWRKVMAVNLDGTFLGCREILPVMKRKGAGSIVNVSSIVSTFATPQTTAYGASKAAVAQLTKTLAIWGAKDGNRIRANSVHPGIIKTRMVDSIFDGFTKLFNTSREALEETSAQSIPLGAFGEPDDVAYLILYLASDESRYVTGSEMMIDGGWRLTDAR